MKRIKLESFPRLYRLTTPYTLPYSLKSYRHVQKAESTFCDLKVIKLTSGKGGNGKVSFFRDAGRAKGPPDGGDGGDGGNVYIQAVAGLTSLGKLRFHYKAEDGRPGAARSLNGRNGENVLIQVPIGTVIKWIPDPREQVSIEALAEENAQSPNDSNINSSETDVTDASLLSPTSPTSTINPKPYINVPVLQDEFSYTPYGISLDRPSYAAGEGWLFRDKDEEYHVDKEFFIDLRKKILQQDETLDYREQMEDYVPIKGIDLDHPGPPVLLLKGGRGGLGNTHFLTPTVRNPRFAKEGRGQLESFFLLELKLIADVGLVGLPNAGKSTLLRAISRARPRVGYWEFTTLYPNIGTISPGISRPSFTVADIPGVVKDARFNKGMGLDFLRHVERSRGIVFVIGLDRPDPVEDLFTLMQELGPQRMNGKKVVIIATKGDIDNTENKYNDLENVAVAKGWNIVPCCAMKNENVEAVIEAMADVAGRENEVKEEWS